MERKRRNWIAAIAAAIFAALASAAAAQTPEDEILAAMARWSEVYSTATDAAEMQALYHPDAVFWGTGGRVPMAGVEEFGPYFQTQFDNFTDRAHGFVDPVIRFYGDLDRPLPLRCHAGRRRRADRGALPLFVQLRADRRRLADHPAALIAAAAMIG
jgi:hypothetical protein